METQYLVTHISVKLTSGYEAFTQAFEKALGRLDLPALQQAKHDPQAVEAAIKAMQGQEGMSLFGIDNLGQLISLTGPPRTAKKYFVGNFLRASQIISGEIRLGLYAPLRVLVYEKEDKTAYVEYELPSSQFSRFGDPLITQSGIGLDGKLERLIAMCDQTQANTDEKP
ncbi:MAG: DUF302 domain-containing protein [Dyadobacter sp.]|uniref:DUF302 domain-containing protein n=1 Tax=Dyadobacter sp. TaxID=1914288 RepID=UPI0032642EB3